MLRAMRAMHERSLAHATERAGERGHRVLERRLAHRRLAPAARADQTGARAQVRAFSSALPPFLILLLPFPLLSHADRLLLAGSTSIRTKSRDSGSSATAARLLPLTHM